MLTASALLLSLVGYFASELSKVFALLIIFKGLWELFLFLSVRRHVAKN